MDSGDVDDDGGDMAVDVKRDSDVASYRPNPKQQAFRNSKAKIRGYGGAMGGGKSRGICEEIFDLAIEHPGIHAPIFRKKHTAIVRTTKITMMEEVIPDRRLIVRQKESQGEDWIKLWNGSTIYFAGLDDPVQWFSSQLGAVAFDEAHEMEEHEVAKLITRLRQPGMPCCAMLGFNPENPGHWLQRWFILGGEETKFGFRKPELILEDADEPIGDSEFVFASAYDNFALSEEYIAQNLSGLPRLLRQRFLEGKWIFVDGKGFFDVEAMEFYNDRVTQPVLVGRTAGTDSQLDRALSQSDRAGMLLDGQVRFLKGSGPWAVWRTPVRPRFDQDLQRMLPAHRYVVTVDVSSGGAHDFSGIQVFSVEDWEQMAEYQDKVDPDILALEAYRIGKIYNNALIVPEITGGWGHTIVKELERLHYNRIYTRRIDDRISKKWTDKLGWDTSTKTRPYMLDTLERYFRNREIRLHGARTLAELGAFVRNSKGKPEAQPGMNDDLVITLAMGVTVAEQLPKELRDPPSQPYATYSQKGA